MIQAIEAKSSLSSHFLPSCELIARRLFLYFSPLLLFFSLSLFLSTSHHPLFPDIRPIVLVDRNFTVYIGICCWRYKSSLKGDDEAYSRVLLSFSFPSARVPPRNCLFADESNRLSWKKYFRAIGKERKKKRENEKRQETDKENTTCYRFNYENYTLRENLKSIRMTLIFN